MARELEILLHQTHVGHLVESDDGDVSFELDESYRVLPGRPVLGQQFEDAPTRTWHGRRARRLPDWFANVLPEGALRDLLLDQHGLSPGDDLLGLLAVLGSDLPGAVAARPATAPWATHRRMEDASSTPPDSPAVTGEGPLRFSLAGVQLKFSMVANEDRLTLPAHGEDGQWIVKLTRTDYAGAIENEFSMLEWARRAGFDVPRCQIRHFGDLDDLPARFLPDDAPVLLVRRYDRARGRRVHQEDFAQVVGLPPRQKYDHITYEQMGVLAHAILGREGLDELVRRLVFTVACGNADAHLKNWSLFYPDGVQATWSPFYDQVATVAWPTLNRNLALKLAGVKPLGQVDLATFERFAQRIERKLRVGLTAEHVTGLVRTTLDELADTWRACEADLPLVDDHRAALRDYWARVPLLRDHGIDGL